MLRSLLLLSILTAASVEALHCMQCDRVGQQWATEEEIARDIELCQTGKMPPTPCKDPTHTHCIVSWFSRGDSGVVVTERKCGIASADQGCTIYNSQISRKERHLISRDVSTKREPSSTLIEVCSKACEHQDCESSASNTSILCVILFVLSRVM